VPFSQPCDAPRRRVDATVAFGAGAMCMQQHLMREDLLGGFGALGCADAPLACRAM
jgi:hypothetical protein